MSTADMCGFCEESVSSKWSYDKVYIVDGIAGSTLQPRQLHCTASTRVEDLGNLHGDLTSSVLVSGRWQTPS